MKTDTNSFIFYAIVWMQVSILEILIKVLRKQFPGVKTIAQSLRNRNLV